jgi:CspA family cold shock protein
LTFRLLWGPAVTWAQQADFLSDHECPVEPSRRGGRRDTMFFNAERGYGFIKPDDGGRDVFVHITAVEQAGLKSLNEGQHISFDVEPDKKGKGPKAVNLVVSG